MALLAQLGGPGSWPDVGRPVADVCNGIGGKAAGWSSSSPGTRRGVRSQSLAGAALGLEQQPAGVEAAILETIALSNRGQTEMLPAFD